jgi:hypothetical protein
LMLTLAITPLFIDAIIDWLRHIDAAILILIIDISHYYFAIDAITPLLILILIIDYYWLLIHYITLDYAINRHII